MRVALPGVSNSSRCAPSTGTTSMRPEMQLRHPRLDAVTVKGQGHAPLLKDAPTIAAVSQFLAWADLATLAASEEIVVGR